MLNAYLKKIAEVSNRGDATEESYYPTLADLLREYCSSTGKKDIHITILPKKTEAGNPDFRVWDGKQHITGYIEAKDPTIDNLDRIEDTEQLKRYLCTFPNLILTNFLEFRLYRNGVVTEKVLAARPVILHKLKMTPPVEKESELLQLFEKFFSFSLPNVYDARHLAVELARRTRFLKDEVIAQELREEEKAGKGLITGFYKAFKDYLISGLTGDEFSDLYAQTITYGLFAARTRSENGFNRKLAYDNIPQTIGILRDVFQFISLGPLPQQMEWIIDDISEVLSVADTNKILHQYFHEGKGKDPVIHFYETFLSEYDPKTQEMRGVYYTPEPVVSYIVRSLHSILKEQFKRPDGFASNTVTVLDPAAGTLTFLAEAAKLAVDEFVSKYGEGGRGNFIKGHILKNFYAFELMMAPYAIGHLKMSFLLEELGYKLQKDDRVKLYLTNTLEMEELPETKFPGMASLSEESHLAGKVKREQPILVILGNPPYSVSSVNKSKFIEGYLEKKKGRDKKGKLRMLNEYVRGIMDDYKDAVRDETNIQPLSDDYIKFIRFAHWKIDRDKKGIIGMITNNSYLSGLIHRGMRKKLLQSFDEIYILNLHGNSRIGEKCPDGSKDENVFDIQQGVSIALFIKKEKHGKTCEVFYRDIYGLREIKRRYLTGHDVCTTEWKRLKPAAPYYFFVEKDFSLQVDYDELLSITEIFHSYSSGVKTHRDHFIVGFTEDELRQRMQTFVSDLPDDLVSQALSLKDTRDWKIRIARERVKETDWKEFVRSYSYRPFDRREICYLPDLIDRGCDRWELMMSFFEDNLGLSVTRQLSTASFLHAFVTDSVTNMCFVSTKTKETGYVFPLYRIAKKIQKGPSTSVMMLLEPEGDYGLRRSNLSPAFVDGLARVFKKAPSPGEIFYYIYAILYSETCRTKYAEFLKIDFPRIPFTKDHKLFKKMSGYGNRLVDLHLLSLNYAQVW
ncbi:MAG: N-6 DNA methylase [Candidatus Eisenbacteria bacterium]|nr:N-6 DNA methylase [Candidatus Eisenbacteria bacterium]